MTYTISTWNSVKDNAVKVLATGDWNTVVEILQNVRQTDDKYDNALFNLTKFDALKQKTGEFVEDKELRKWVDRRVGKNVSEIGGFVVDYDNESLLQHHWTMDEVAEKFKKYNFLMYSSYSYWKTYPAVERFRLVIPFAKPMVFNNGEENWKPYLADIHKFFGYEEAERLPEAFQYENEETGKMVTMDKPSIDRASFNPVQGYFLPACPVDKHVVFKINEGEFLDTSIFKREDKKPVVANLTEIPEGAIKGGEGQILKNTFDVIQYLKDKNLYLKPMGNSGKHSIICPWSHEHTHANKSGTALLPARNGGLPNINCFHNHTANTNKLIKELPDDVLRQYCLTKPISQGLDKIIARLAGRREREQEEELLDTVTTKIEDLLVFDEVVAEPYSRARREKIVEKKLLKQRNEYTLAMAFEGFGKSHMAVLLGQAGEKVVFASSSNKQAVEQAESFKKAGLRVQTILGRKHVLQNQFGVEIQESDYEIHPWAGTDMDETATRRWMLTEMEYTKEDVEKIWDDSSAAEPDFANHDIICTTIARTQVWGKIQAKVILKNAEEDLNMVKESETGERKIAQPRPRKQWFIKDEDRIVPRGTHIIFDDPARINFLMQAAYKKKFENLTINGRKLEIRIYDADTDKPRKYFIRPYEFTLGYGLPDTYKTFTTTEHLTSHLIKRMYPDIVVPQLMPTEKMDAGRITMISTNLVASTRDAIILAMAERWKKNGHDFTYIADGQGAEHNLENTKGKNEFREHDSVIEISKPHVRQIIEMCDEFQWSNSDRQAMAGIIALDNLQQAIGRNSGYRFSDENDQSKRKEAVVLVDPWLFPRLIKTMRYAVRNVIDDPKATLRNRKENDFSPLVTQIVEHVGNVDRYVFDDVGMERNCFLNDLKDAIGNMGNKKTTIMRVQNCLIQLIVELLKNSERYQERIKKVERWLNDLGFVEWREKLKRIVADPGE